MYCSRRTHGVLAPYPETKMHPTCFWRTGYVFCRTIPGTGPRTASLLEYLCFIGWNGGSAHEHMTQPIGSLGGCYGNWKLHIRKFPKPLEGAYTWYANIPLKPVFNREDISFKFKSTSQPYNSQSKHRMWIMECSLTSNASMTVPWSVISQ